MEKLRILKAETCSPEDLIKNIAKKMLDKKCRRYFVIDKDKNLIGLCTTVDITAAVAKGKDPKKTKVKDIMTKKVKYITLEDDLDKAISIMNSLKTYVCPVVKDKKLLGILSYQEILAHAIKAARE